MKISHLVDTGQGIVLQNVNDLRFIRERLNECNHFYTARLITPFGYYLPFALKFFTVGRELYVGLTDENRPGVFSLRSISHFDFCAFSPAEHY